MDRTDSTPSEHELLRTVEDRFIRILNTKIDTEDNKTTIRIPGFKYDDFDRAGNLSLTKLHRVFEINRVVMIPWLRGHDDVPDSVTFVVVGRHWTISRQLYVRAAIDFPMTTSWRLTGSGRSSLDKMQTLTDDRTGHLLARCITRYVGFDMKTRTSFTLPRAFHEQYKTGSADGERFPSFGLRTSADPARVFACSVRVRYDDTDMLNHTTQSAYVDFVRECASQATAAGFFKLIAGDFAFYTVQSLTTVHTGESFAGDELRVTTWEDEDNALLLYFVVRRKEQTLCTAKMKLFDVAVSKL